eukprot:CAMPEP_0204905810 /NCGR_PEP_ID=MMETSP1397-20131031/5633_1 /ASSEMBLY_ACC=CAM_ASM_000891 /TAXON_ID=49980 /ORGANISM="Climacostomum Climacostomum virens, Strain Stock W-24" /LENGTH=619 /DNA_ID=CAMNT_0052074745 /DNA_START=370 /DNA_END=2229 /DNA_ORIENTATION=+
MSDPFATFKAVQICPGISLLDLLQLERFQPMRRQSVLPFFQDLCQRKKLLLLDASSIKAWPEQLIEQDAIFLLLEEWSLFLPLKLNTSLMFGEVSAVLAITQPTDVKSQLVAFKQALEKERLKKVKVSPMRKKTKVQFDTTEVRLRGRLPASIKLMSAFNLLMKESSLFNIPVLAKTLTSCCSDYALRELKTDYWAFIMKRTNLSIDVIKDKLEQAEAVVPRGPTPVDELEDDAVHDDPVHEIESGEASTLPTAIQSPEKFFKPMGTSPVQEEAKFMAVSPQATIKAEAAPAPRKSIKFAKKISELRIDDIPDSDTIHIGSSLKLKHEKFAHKLAIESHNPKEILEAKQDLEVKDGKEATETKRLSLELKSEGLSTRERTVVRDEDQSSIELDNSVTFEARRTSENDAEIRPKRTYPLVDLQISGPTEQEELKLELPDYMQRITKDEFDDSTSQQGNLSQNQEPAFRSITDSEDDSKSPKLIDFSRETPINILTSSDLSFSSSEFYGSLHRISEVKEETQISDVRLKLPVPSSPAGSAGSDDSSISSWDDDADENANAVSLPTNRGEKFNHKSELFKPRHMLIQNDVGEPLEEEPQERDDMMECCSCECSCSESQCLLI